MIGVGDGPWDVMKDFDDKLPQRAFDNFQFVNFTEILQGYRNNPSRMEAVFALKTLMEIPDQFKVRKSFRLFRVWIALQPFSRDIIVIVTSHETPCRSYKGWGCWVGQG